MTHEEGEVRVKALQKRFLTWVENHSYLQKLEPIQFNQIRHKAFSSTFEAFRMGRVGTGVYTDSQVLWRKFFGWALVSGLPPDIEFELQTMCFVISLEAFRAGALVTGAESNALHAG